MHTPRDPLARRDLRTATLFAVLAALAVAFIWTAPGPALDRAAETIRWLRRQEDATGRAIATLGYIVAWTRVSSPRRRLRIDGGRGTIAVDELAARLREAVLETPQLREAAVRVANRHRRGVSVRATLSVTPDARLAETADAAREAIAETLRERTGLPLAEPPEIELHYEELILSQRKGQRRESDAA